MNRSTDGLEVDKLWALSLVTFTGIELGLYSRTRYAPPNSVCTPELGLHPQTRFAPPNSVCTPELGLHSCGIVYVYGVSRTIIAFHSSVRYVRQGVYWNLETLFSAQNDLNDMIRSFETMTDGISPLMKPLLKPFINRVNEKILAGLTILNWNSLNIEVFIKDVYTAMDELSLIVKRVSCR